jgi:hypothetical protein
VNDPLEATLSDAVEFLENEGVPYALVGGLAASIRGQNRTTADVDMIIAVDVNRALALIDELSDSKFAPLFSGVHEVVQKAFILPIHHRETGVKVDLALGMSGFEQQAIKRASYVTIGDCQVMVLLAEDLVVMKVLAGRPQDDADVRGIMIAQKETLDWKYCFEVARQLSEAVAQDLVTRLQVLRREVERDQPG